jgi:hypothetical protein
MIRPKLKEKSTPPVGRFATLMLAACASAMRWTIDNRIDRRN